jgi:catechol 2,3-dioxygenase-like lactoylglutathione lyase family enzyme
MRRTIWILAVLTVIAADEPIKLSLDPADHDENSPFEVRKITKKGEASTGGAPIARPGRSVYWRIRSSDLYTTVTFLKEVFDMKVVRHEELEGWSRTVMGFAEESKEKGLLLEVVFYYTISPIAPSNGHQQITVGITEDKLEAVAELVTTMGFTVDLERYIIDGPDGYQFQLKPLDPDEEDEPIAHATLRTNNLEESGWLYTSVLGMSTFMTRKHPETGHNVGAIVGYNQDSFTIMLSQVDLISASEESAAGAASNAADAGGENSTDNSNVIEVTPWDGRHTIVLPEKELREVYAKAEKADGGKLVVTELQEVRGFLGGSTVLMAMLTDQSGYELCLLSAEDFEKAVAASPADFVEPNYMLRKRIFKGIVAAAKEKERAGGSGDDTEEL